MAPQAPIKDFSTGRTAPQFQIDGKVYTAKRAIGLAHIQQIAGLAADLEAASTADKLALFESIFALLLKRESADRFAAHVRDDDDPIPLDQLTHIMTWLLEEQGLRPTEPSSESPAGSDAAASGTTSTDGPQPAA